MMKKTITLSLILFALLPSMMRAQDNIKDLTVTSKIDSTYVFGFDLKESRSAKGGIWNLKTGKPETPLNYSTARKDTLDGQCDKPCDKITYTQMHFKYMD